MLKKSPSEGLFATFQETMLPKVRVVKGLFILNEKDFFCIELPISCGVLFLNRYLMIFGEDFDLWTPLLGDWSSLHQGLLLAASS